MTDRQALLSAAGKQRPYKAVNIKTPGYAGGYLFVYTKRKLTCVLFFGILVRYSITRVMERFILGEREEFTNADASESGLP